MKKVIRIGSLFLFVFECMVSLLEIYSHHVWSTKFN